MFVSQTIESVEKTRGWGARDGSCSAAAILASMTTPRPYSELQGLEHVYLEDSYVLRIRWTGDAIIFWLEAILTEHHPDYVPPKPGERYCYREKSAALSLPSYG